MSRSLDINDQLISKTNMEAPKKDADSNSIEACSYAKSYIVSLI